MSATQKALIYANIPTNLYQYTVEKRLRDRFPASPINYPSMTVTFLSEGIKKHWNTWGPIETVWNDTTKRFDSYYGEQDSAMISVTLWSEDEDELRIITESLYKQLRLNRLSLDWVNDQVKLTNVKSVQWLEPYADEFIQEHIWRSVIDFEVEYLWKELELVSSIRSYGYLFGVPDSSERLNEMYSAQNGSYLMSVLLKGFRSTYEIDIMYLISISNSYDMSLTIS